MDLQAKSALKTLGKLWKSEKVEEVKLMILRTSVRWMNRMRDCDEPTSALLQDYMKSIFEAPETFRKSLIFELAKSNIAGKSTLSLGVFKVLCRFHSLE